MDSLVSNLTLAQLQNASKEIKDVTIPAISLFLANERRNEADEDPIYKKPFIMEVMKNERLKGFAKFADYADKLKQSKLGKELLHKHLFASFLDANQTDQEMADDGKVDNASARIKILYEIIYDPDNLHIKSVDDVFMYILKHYLGNQRILILPKDSAIQLYATQYMRILSSKYGNFVEPPFDESDEDYWAINLKRLLEYGYTDKNIFIHYSDYAVTQFDPDVEQASLKKDFQMNKTHDYLYIGLRPDVKTMKLICAVINHDTKAPIYKMHAKPIQKVSTHDILRMNGKVATKSDFDEFDPFIEPLDPLIELSKTM